MYLLGNPRCPIESYKTYLKHRPAEMMDENCPFYLQDIKNPKTEIWYQTMRVGKNKLNDFAKTMATELNLNGKHTNHSARRTMIQQLSESGIQDNDIIAVTGHRNAEALNSYKAPSTAVMNKMSSILAQRICTAPASNQPSTSATSTSTLETEEFWDIHGDELDQVLSSIETHETAGKEITVNVPKSINPVNPQSSSTRHVPLSLLNGTITGNVTVNINYNYSEPLKKRRRIITSNTMQISSSQSSENSQ